MTTQYNKQNNWNDAKFIHLRYVDDFGEVLSHGGRTVAYVEEADGIHYATANCHVYDRYSKDQGRIKAANRILSSRFRKRFNGTAKEFIAYQENAWLAAVVE